MSLIEGVPTAKIPVMIDERKIGMSGHRRLGEIRAYQHIIELCQTCFTRTPDVAQKEVLDVLIETFEEMRQKVEDELLRIARRAQAVEILDQSAPEDLPN